MWTDARHPFKKNDYMFAYHPKLEHSFIKGKVAWGCTIDEIMVDGSIRVKWFDEKPTCTLVGNKSVWRAPSNHPIIPLIIPEAGDEAEEEEEDEDEDDESPPMKKSKKVSKKHKSKQDKSVKKSRQQSPNPKKRKIAVEERVPPRKEGRVVSEDEVGEAIQPQAKKPVSIQPQARKPVSIQPQARKPVSIQPQARKPVSIQPQVKQVAFKDVDDNERDADWCEAYVESGDVIMEVVQKVGSWLDSLEKVLPLAESSGVFARDVDYDELVKKHKVIKTQLTAAKDELKALKESSAAATLAAESELAKVKLDASDASGVSAGLLAKSEERNTKLMEKMAKLEQKVKQLAALKQLSRDEIQENSRVRNNAAPVFTLNHRASREFVDQIQSQASYSKGKKG